jgi:hypothetical protein
MKLLGSVIKLGVEHQESLRHATWCGTADSLQVNYYSQKNCNSLYYHKKICLFVEMAIMQLRKTRPGAIDTIDQEKAVENYYKELCNCPPEDK